MHYEQIARIGNGSNAVVVVSTAIREHLQRLDPTLTPRLSLIPYGIHPQPTRDLARTEDPDVLRIVFTGRLSRHQKRVADLAAIALELDRRGVNFEMSIAGEGYDQDQVRYQARSLVLKRKVRFVGKLEHAEIMALLCESDVYLLPSAYEGLSVGLLEAMGASLVPVVSNMRSGVPDIIRNGENGLIAPIGGIQEFADALEYLANNRERREQLAREARRTIVEEGYCVQDMADRYYAVLEQIMATPFERPKGMPLPPSWLVGEVTRKHRREFAMHSPGAAARHALNIRLRKLPS